MSTVIKIENLSKSYRLGEVGTGTIAHDLNRFYARVRGKEDPYTIVGTENDRTKKATKGEVIKALNDINLEIKEGELLGIIGKNGAGKSTLLKILSRITAPSSGTYKIKGRMASLLEVGTGFHPEMTGRENIYMNGTIMGMRKKEIDSKLEEIVEFAGVVKYLDTPVKRYSSGMTVRLGFAVAAHLNSEILVVDEVLAVGDAEFQKKAIGKMQDVSANQGRTVLFVSHNMGTIAKLCETSILLNNGNIIKRGTTENVVNFYLQNNSNNNRFELKQANKDVGILSAFTINDKSEQISVFTHDSKIQIIVKLRVNIWVIGAEFRIVLRDVNGKAIFTTDLALEKDMIINDQINIIAEIPSNFLRPGNYSLTFATFVPHQFIIDLLENILAIDIVDGGSDYASSEGLDYGYIFFEPTWIVNNNILNNLKVKKAK